MKYLRVFVFSFLGVLAFSVLMLGLACFIEWGWPINSIDWQDIRIIIVSFVLMVLGTAVGYIVFSDLLEI